MAASLGSVPLSPQLIASPSVPRSSPQPRPQMHRLWLCCSAPLWGFSSPLLQGSPSALLPSPDPGCSSVLLRPIHTQIPQEVELYSHQPHLKTTPAPDAVLAWPPFVPASSASFRRLKKGNIDHKGCTEDVGDRKHTKHSTCISLCYLLLVYVVRTIIIIPLFKDEDTEAPRRN